MKVLQQQINVTYGFPGQVQGVDEVLVQNERLYPVQAISEQTLMNSRSDLEGYIASVESAQVAIRKAQENLDDTIIYTLMNGRVSLDDIAVGSYAMAGNTT